jgi:hypothetical protein
MSNTLATFMPPGRAIRSVRPNASVCFLVADEMTLLIEMVVNLAMNRTVGVADLLHRSTIRRKPVGHDGSRLTVSRAASSGEAAKRLAHQNGGAIAFRWRGDIEFGRPESIEILAGFGKLPTDVRCLIREA